MSRMIAQQWIAFGKVTLLMAAYLTFGALSIVTLG